MLLEQAVDGEAARVKPEVLGLGLLALQLFAQAAQQLELPSGVQPLLPPRAMISSSRWRSDW